MNLIDNKGGFKIIYAHEDKGLQQSFVSASTLGTAMSIFNTLDHTSGFKCIGDIIVDRLNIDGVLTDTFLMTGRYGVPTRIGPRETNPGVGSSTRRRPRVRRRRYNRG